MKLVTYISGGFVAFFIAFVVIYGMIKRVPIFDTFIEGAKEGLSTVITILPYLVAMLVAVQMLKSSGALDALVSLLAPLLSFVGIPMDLGPLLLMRPFSGSGATAIFTQLVGAVGPDSYTGRLASTVMGSSETILYAVGLYFGYVGVKRTRYTVPVSMLSEFVGIVFAAFLCKTMFGL